MTPEQITIARALRQVSFPLQSNDKRFYEAMQHIATNFPDSIISQKQAVYLKNLAWKYRRQLPAEIVSLGLKKERAIEAEPPLRREPNPALFYSE